MPNKKEGILKIKDKNGQEKEYSILASFRHNDKYYVMYTDYKRDEKRNIKVYASIYNPDDEQNKIEKIKDKKEIDFIKEYIKKLEEGLKTKMKLTKM